MENPLTARVPLPHYQSRPVDATGRDVERRGVERFPVSGVFIFQNDTVQGRVVDLSTTGLTILTSSRVRPGQHIDFEIHSDYLTEVCGTVRWARLDRLMPQSDGSFESVYIAGISLNEQPHLCKRSHLTFD